MNKCLFLLCLCLVPFLVFSSTTFTSQNPIELPSGNFVPVLDTKGNPLDPHSSYRIVSIFRGGLGGDVYLGPSPNSTVPCNNGVFRYNSDVGPTGTPVGFIPVPRFTRGIFENQDINILFTIPVVKLCVNYNNWKIGDYDRSVGARLLETGGTIRQQDSTWFRIVKSAGRGYNLLYCPGPFVCPSCPLDQCRQAVGVIIQNRKRRLALVNDHPLAVNFAKV